MASPPFNISRRTVLEADKNLLQFASYEEYLESHFTKADICYLNSSLTARRLVQIGGDTLTKEEFYRKLAAITEVVYPKKRPYQLSSAGLFFDDVLIRELADREQSNRLGMIATLIFLRYFNKGNHEVSGYIDFTQRILNEDWTEIFKGNKKLALRTTDLVLFNWRNGKYLVNNSANFKVVFDVARGLLFQHRHDRKIICVDPSYPVNNKGISRYQIISKRYPHAVLYDHVVRRTF